MNDTLFIALSLVVIVLVADFVMKRVINFFNKIR